MSKILALSGKKGSGKDTSANFLLGLELLSIGVVHNYFMLNNEGRLWVTDLQGNKEFAGRFEIRRSNQAMEDFRVANIDPWVRLYSFADLLKKEICIKILGLTYEQCFGTDTEKNTDTHLSWDDMPGIYTNEVMYKMSVKSNPELEGIINYHPPGVMAAREVMQHVGTDMFRKMYGGVWVDSLIRQIKEDDSELAIITDCRFPNEVTGVQKVGGKVIRLLRHLGDTDEHESEKALDNDRFNHDQFDFVLDNSKMSIASQNEELYKILSPIGWVPELANPTEEKIGNTK